MNLVRGVDASRARQAIVGGVLKMCRELDIAVLAEGVETEGERNFFVHAGVTLMQGYLFTRPAFQAHVAMSTLVRGASGRTLAVDLTAATV